MYYAYASEGVRRYRNYCDICIILGARKRAVENMRKKLLFKLL